MLTTSRSPAFRLVENGVIVCSPEQTCEQVEAASVTRDGDADVVVNAATSFIRICTVDSRLCTSAESCCNSWSLACVEFSLLLTEVS